jgi:hypothetical protein
MLLDFFYLLRSQGLPVSVSEYLSLLAGLKAGVVGPLSLAVKANGSGSGLGSGSEPESGEDSACSLDDLYYFSKMTFIKDERHFDKFDRVFDLYFKGVESLGESLKQVPLDWLKKSFEKELTPEQLRSLKAMDWEELMSTLKKRLEEQKERHAGGNKWIGTGGTSPFGHSGVNPRGVRIGGVSKNKSAVKVWEQRQYKDYDDSVELGTRTIKVALRRLRRFAREGAQEELDLDNTIRSTAVNAGYLDIKMTPERRNNVKVLLLMDIGGTMDEHVARVEELFSAVKSEFKHLEFFYFHNCIYDYLWKNNKRRYAEKFPTWDIIRKYNKDHKLIFVGDATMSPYEIVQPGGSVEYNNQEPGAVWLQRLTHAYPKFAWINPEPQGVWQYRQSVSIIQELMGQKMYPLSLRGLEQAMRELSK